MTVIALDLGLAQTGVAISEGNLAKPYTTIRSKNLTSLVSQLEDVIQKENIQEIVIGKLDIKNENYLKGLQEKIETLIPQIKVSIVDETLTTRQARETMIKLQVPKKKKKGKEHQIAACLILQNYLDENA